MKCSKSFLLMVLSTFMFFASCSKDEPKEVSPEYKAALFVNTWCTSYGNGQSTLLTLANTHSVTLVETAIVDGNTTTQTISGSWMYYPENNILVIQYGYASSPDNYTITSASYKVRELKNGKMVLLNQETGAINTYFRFADSFTATVGETLDNLVSASTLIESSNPAVISILSSGIPEVVAVGKAYLFLSNDTNAYAIEIIVLHQSQIFVGYLGRSIVDVLEVYGDPDVTGTIDKSFAILYNTNLEEGLSAIQVQYDPVTLEVTRILVQYSDEKVWSSDVKFISSWLNQEGEFYFPEHSMLESDFLISSFESNGKYYISYNNLVYFNENAHYAPEKVIQL